MKAIFVGRFQVIVCGVALFAMSAGAQTSQPRKDAAASVPTPRLPDGHPDLNGVWHHYFGAGALQKVGDSVVYALGHDEKPAGLAPVAVPKPDPKPEYKPEFIGKVKQLSEDQVKEDPTLHCVPPGVPRIGAPQQILQTSKQIAFLYADVTGNQWRVIYMDGRQPDPDAESTYNGFSTGRWDGDTLVINSTNFTDETWLGDNGLFHSDKLHIVERLRRVGNTLEYQMTAQDPDVLAKPWTITRSLPIESEMLEEAPPCIDKDAGHYVTPEHHDNPR